VISAGTIGKLLFCIQHIFSDVRLQVACSCLYGFSFLVTYFIFLLLNSIKIWDVVIAGHPTAESPQDARAMAGVVRVDATG
jgi:hypothetical protein